MDLFNERLKTTPGGNTAAHNQRTKNMTNFQETMIQHEINGAARWTASMRDYMRAGDYHMAHFCAMELAKELAAADKYLYATDGEMDETTAAQIYTAAIERAQENASENDYNPESAQTVADLRQALKDGNADAAATVNDLISDNPNQATAWITRTDIDEIESDLTDEQRAELMEYLRTRYELIDTADELCNAREMMDL